MKKLWITILGLSACAVMAAPHHHHARHGHDGVRLAAEIIHLTGCGLRALTPCPQIVTAPAVVTPVVAAPAVTTPVVAAPVVVAAPYRHPHFHRCFVPHRRGHRRCGR